MAKKPTQQSFDVFKQKQIKLIEKWADKFDETRTLIANLKADLKNAKMKLKESAHKYASDLDRQESPKGESLLIYARGDYRVILKTTEDVAVKIGEDSKAPGEDDDVSVEVPQ
jgi:hypothetical protein